jgi:hypothetical protein
VRDEHYSPFKGPRPAAPAPRAAITLFVMARVRGDQTDSMCGSLRTGAHGYEAVYLLNTALYRTQWFATEAETRADLATHQDALAAAGWTSVPFDP